MRVTAIVLAAGSSRRLGRPKQTVVLEGETLVARARFASRRRRAADAPIVATGYEGAAGAPAVFAARFHSELLALRGDVGARTVIEAHRDETVVIPFEAAAVDLDSVGDLHDG